MAFMIFASGLAMGVALGLLVMSAGALKGAWA